MADFQSAVGPHVHALLEPGEELRGVCAASQTTMFKGRVVALAATDRRLIVLPVTRKLAPDGEPILLPPERIADAQAEGGGGGWADVTSGIMDAAAVTLKLRTTDGQKLKLNMMRGTGPGPFAKLGGGEGQKQGVEAVARFFGEAAL